ncbi:hypothetical protein D9M72_538760 [compost metagenome]
MSVRVSRHLTTASASSLLPTSSETGSWSISWLLAPYLASLSVDDWEDLTLSTARRCEIVISQASGLPASGLNFAAFCQTWRNTSWVVSSLSSGSIRTRRAMPNTRRDVNS